MTAPPLPRPPSLAAHQVAVYLPERQHPNYGVVRAMVRDASDVRTNGSTPFYLDSGGCVSANAACTAAANAANASRVRAAGAEGQGGSPVRRCGVP